MGINISSLETLAQRVGKYAKACGVKSILQTKPPALKGVNVAELKLIPLTEDVLTISNPNYLKMSKLETDILPTSLHNSKLGKYYTEEIPKIRNLTTEDAAVVTENGRLVSRPDLRNGTDFEYSQAKIDEFKKLTDAGENLHLIHNHPIEGTLSASDIQMFLTNKFKSFMATTPSGGYAFIERRKPLVGNFENILSLKEDIKNIGNLENLAITKIFRTEKSNIKRLELWDEFKDKQLKGLIEKYKTFDLRYEYKKGNIDASKKYDDIINEIATNSDIKKQLINEGYSQVEISQMLKAIEETPLESFLLK